MKTLGIVGGGITGLTCAYKLQDDYKVTLFEKDCNVGGQAQTLEVNGIAVESAVSVVGELTYIEFYKLMKEIGFNNFKPYELTGLHAHDQEKTKLYIDINPRRLFKLLPKYVKDSPLGLFRTAQIAPFLYRLYSDYRKGKLDGVLVLDAYKLYPGYELVISTVLTILSLITAVDVKNTTISHVLNFIFDFENNRAYKDPVAHVFNTFIHTFAPLNGVGEYIQKLKNSTRASFRQDAEITKLKRNPDSTITITEGYNQEHTFDKVIIATQPFSVSSFLEYKSAEEGEIFNRLAKLSTYTMVTNHTDSGILEGVKPARGLVDYRLDYYENTSQVTITRSNHFYTAQTLPDSFTCNPQHTEDFTDTGITPDNYSISKTKILSQHIHAVPNMTPETSLLFNEITQQCSENNLHFACAALSKYPTSQEGGVRSALRVVNELHEARL